MNDAEVNKIKNKIIRQFSLKIGLSDFYKKLYNLDFLKHNLKKLYGYHPVSFSSIEEAGIWAILSQHSNFQHAHSQKINISSQYSFKESIKSLDFQGFPNIEQLNSISKKNFVEITGDFRKATYLSNFISTLNNIEIDNLYSFSYNKLFDFLVAIKGIGVWSSEFIILRGAANFKKVPLSEKANIKVFQKYYDGKIDEYISFYGEYSGLWIHYLRIYDYLNK
ncbi:DNA-3-methyladenine glycosylase [Streptococcus huangxiaojuni]|uniref:DNA-3-methyladenine glycosylase n=1 Tax=Streptococcus huangxiaojuni TaxID=3237239 RepID=UPI0034A0D1E4